MRTLTHDELTMTILALEHLEHHIRKSDPEVKGDVEDCVELRSAFEEELTRRRLLRSQKTGEG